MKQLTSPTKPDCPAREEFAKRARGNQAKTGSDKPTGPKWPKRQGIVMIKALLAIGIAAFVAAALTVLPGFAPQVEASVPPALAKADRLDVHPVGRDCSQQAWPNFEASCLRVAGKKQQVTIHEARLVTAVRR
jgi:hypothetical protein